MELACVRSGTRLADSEAMAVAAHYEPNPGDVVAGKYVLHEQIAEGGMGLVFIADQPALARQVAIKMMRGHLAKDPKFVRRFHEKAVAASRVAHPNSVAIIDYGITFTKLPFIVMELVRGRTLTQVLREDRCIAAAKAIGVVDQVLAGVAAAHEAGVIHADLKSDNVLIERRADGNEYVKIADYGLACMFEGESASGDRDAISGTPEYMAPEIVVGARPSRASDVYAVGVILYELLTGTTPFAGGTSPEIMLCHVDGLVVPPSLRRLDPTLATSLDRVVLRALDKSPESRFPDANTFRIALRGVAEESEPVARSARGTEPTHRARARG